MVMAHSSNMNHSNSKKILKACTIGWHWQQNFDKIAAMFYFRNLMRSKNLCTWSWLLVSCLLSACVLHQPATGITKYQQALSYYEAKSYAKATQLLEEVLPTLRGKKEEATAYFYQAYCSFHQKKYVQAAERFSYFYEVFFRDPRKEEALYMQGHALYLDSPYVNLSQKSTQKAVHVLRAYLGKYPHGVYMDKASAQLSVLMGKLALKAFNSAKLYHQLAHYRAAVVTLENFQKDFPDSSYHEEAAYLKVDAQYCYCKEVEKARKHAPEYDYKNSNREKVDTLDGDKKAPLQYDQYLKSTQKVDVKEQLRIGWNQQVNRSLSGQSLSWAL